MRLLERSGELAALGAAARSAALTDGRVALIQGEAGIGKSSLLRAMRAQLPAEGRLLVGYCDALSTPRALGPFKDVGRAMGRGVLAALTTGDRDHVMAAVLDALSDGPPTVLAVEDVHWADEATLDVLRFLARRLEGLPALLVLTVRDDEAERTPALRQLLGELSSAQGLLRLPLKRLSPGGVAALSADSTLDARKVYELTDGNPYLVSEVLATADDTGVPATVVDGVLGRLRRLPADVQEMVQQLSVVPGVVRRPLVDAFDPNWWRLLDVAEAAGLLHVTGTTVTFRHELTRRAVADSLPGSQVVDLNRRALDALEQLGEADLSALVHHAVQAGDEEAVRRHGPGAAREASASGAHREAAAHYATTLEYEDRFPLAERAQLWDEYAVELYTVALGTRIVAAGERAVALRRELGDQARLAASLRWLSRFCWYAGERGGAERAAGEAVVAAEHSGDELLLGLTLSNQSQLAMLANDPDLAIPLAERAAEIARRHDDAPVLSHALNNLGAALYRRGEDGRAALEEAIAVALSVDDHEDACRGYVNLAWSLYDLGDLDAAEPLVREGIAHASAAEFLAFWQYLTATWAKVQLARARWDVALDAIERLSPEAPPSWCVALQVRARLEARTGRGDPVATVRQAWAIAEGLEEMQRVGPSAVAALEVAALTGTEPVVDGLAVFHRAIEAREPGLLPELGYRLGVLGIEAPGLDDLLADEPGPWSLMAARRWQDAAATWHRLGWPYYEAEALAADDDPRSWSRALELLDRLGAEPLAQQVRRRLRGAGSPAPRGRASATKADPAGLTGRQRAVLELLGDGLTNAEIARRLVVSVRTVDSHVAAILRKLGAQTRRQAVSSYAALDPDVGRPRQSSR